MVKVIKNSFYRKAVLLFIVSFYVALFAGPGTLGSETRSNSIVSDNTFHFPVPVHIHADSEPVYSLGDVKGTGAVEVSDAILVLRHIVGLTNLNEADDFDSRAYDRAGVSGAAELSISDAIIILRYIVELITEFPAISLEDKLMIDKARAQISEITGEEYTDLEFGDKMGKNEYAFLAASHTLYSYDTAYDYISRIYFSNEQVYTEDPLPEVISMDNAKNNASAFLENYYPNKDINKDINLEQSDLNDHGNFKTYHFVWREKVDDIKGPNYVSVNVDPYEGNIITYSSRYMDVTVPTTPVVSEKEVIALVKEEAPPSAEYTIEDTKLDIWVNPNTGEDYLRWSVYVLRKLEGNDSEDDFTFRTVFYYDAITGKAIK